MRLTFRPKQGGRDSDVRLEPLRIQMQVREHRAPVAKGSGNGLDRFRVEAASRALGRTEKHPARRVCDQDIAVTVIAPHRVEGLPDRPLGLFVRVREPALHSRREQRRVHDDACVSEPFGPPAQDLVHLELGHGCELGRHLLLGVVLLKPVKPGACRCQAHGSQSKSQKEEPRNRTFLHLVPPLRKNPDPGQPPRHSIGRCETLGSRYNIALETLR